MSTQLDTVTTSGLHFKKGGGFHKQPLPVPLEPGAKDGVWHPETLTLAYVTEDEQDVITEHELVLTQQQIDDAAAMVGAFDLSAAQAAKRDEIAEACEAEYSADIEVEGIPFRTHLEARADVNDLINLLAPLEVYANYKCADGVFRDITREQFLAGYQAAMARKSAAFTKRKTLTDAIDAASTQAELEAINW
ncbi:DUF4376 domain-containing protein [Cerasicoccus frondis]|uniref:DUF4376 domain-containing protein n=1 Tax=Cerasicoccus frondis TaxID=490090 RepID=UPI002852BE99|nr:DUF4376 domain-containing protein [Cerasicoccus frondis]